MYWSRLLCFQIRVSGGGGGRYVANDRFASASSGRTTPTRIYLWPFLTEDGICDEVKEGVLEWQCTWDRILVRWKVLLLR